MDQARSTKNAALGDVRTPPYSLAALERRITILGSTGSVGCNTLDLIGRARAAYQDRREAPVFPIEALTANRRVDLLIEQALKFRPKVAVIADPTLYEPLRAALEGSGVDAAAGPEALLEAAQRPSEWVMAAIVGAAGLRPTLEAVKRGCLIALANKECLVCAGDLLTRVARDSGAELLPVDSEHNAIFQVFAYDQPESVEGLILTASGGPFREWTQEQMAFATPEQAVAHPNWSMGAKISVDSATLMNKGLELIEACHLFPVPPDKIEIIVHPQSIIHSLVRYIDGSVLAQLGTPDMRTPIASTLAWPERMVAPSPRLDLTQVAELTFEKPDLERFPALSLARESLQTGGGAPTILNAANEVAVQGFLDRQVGFLDIVRIVHHTLEVVCRGQGGLRLDTFEDVNALDERARAVARARVVKLAKS